MRLFFIYDATDLGATVYKNDLSCLKEIIMKKYILILVLFIPMFGAGCKSLGFETSESSTEKDQEHRGIDFLPPVKDYKDRAGSAAGSVEKKAAEVHKQFEILDR